MRTAFPSSSSRAAARNVSDVFNRSLDVDQRLGFLDKDISTENLVSGHPKLVGTLLLVGSGFAFLFSVFNLDVPNFINIFFGSRNPTVFGEIIFQTIAWIGRMGCLFGVLAGIGLILAPQKLRAIEKRMNRWVETRLLIDKINRPFKGLDTIFFRYPIFFGLFGGSVYCLLIVLSILNLLR